MIVLNGCALKNTHIESQQDDKATQRAEEKDKRGVTTTGLVVGGVAVATIATAAVIAPVAGGAILLFSALGLTGAGGWTYWLLTKDKGESDDTVPLVKVKTYFATNRNLIDITNFTESFGTERSDLKYGICIVSIPVEHKIGEIETPSFLKLDFVVDPQEHVSIQSIDISDINNFYIDLSKDVKSSPKDSTFIFIHGYNSTFEDAAKRTAQMAHDLNFSGPPVFYSWPSKESIGLYTHDEQNIQWAEKDLISFLEDFIQRSQAQRIFLIAHSIGNRALTRAVIEVMKNRPDLEDRITEIILAAPDIDAEVFKRDIAPKITEHGRPVTLYASSNDDALHASKKLHGHPRAGDSGENLLIINGIDTIDATNINPDLTFDVEHSYFADKRPVLSDLYYLIEKELRPDDRFTLEAVDTQKGRYWRFRK